VVSQPQPATGAGRGVALLVVFVLVGAAVSVGLGVYGREHTPTFEAISTFGFSALIDMKAWFATVAVALGVVQVLTALRIFGRIGQGPAPRAVGLLHRGSGALAVLFTLPVAYHCLWSLGYQTYDSRVWAHSLLGCALYGVFVTKMLALRSSRLPGWALPLVGGLLFTVLVGVWVTSALWYFNQPDI
jgi:hypothetical protein